MQKEENSVPIILDTDIDMDVDDVGALAVLHALADLGEANPLGVICDIPLEDCAKCAVTINIYYNRKDLPVGVYSEVFETSQRYRQYRKARDEKKHFTLYNRKVSEEFPPTEGNYPKIWDAVSLYRYLLSQSKDSSVRIVAIGLLTALSALLESEPDEYSSLNGIELVKKKVDFLITMGLGEFPESKDIFNWIIDWESTQKVLKNWPTKLVIQPLGAQFLTGKCLSTKTPISNPVRRSYEIYFNGRNKGNFSWDPLTVLYAVRGKGDIFKEIEGYKIVTDSEPGKNHWKKNINIQKSHVALQLKGKKRDTAKRIDSLLIKPPKTRIK